MMTLNGIAQNFANGWPPVVDAMRRAVAGDALWEDRLAALPYTTVGLHLAIFVEPYLSYVLAGRKTIESRFSKRRCAPFGRVCRGDILILKRSSGPIVGLCEVGDVWFYHLDAASLRAIRASFTDALCAQDTTFWRDRAAASYATLMRVSSVRACDPIDYVKRDRRGWVILKQSGEPAPGTYERRSCGLRRRDRDREIDDFRSARRRARLVPCQLRGLRAQRGAEARTR